MYFHINYLEYWKCVTKEWIHSCSAESYIPVRFVRVWGCVKAGCSHFICGTGPWSRWLANSTSILPLTWLSGKLHFSFAQKWSDITQPISHLLNLHCSNTVCITNFSQNNVVLKITKHLTVKKNNNNHFLQTVQIWKMSFLWSSL